MSRYVTQITITEWPTQGGVLLWEQPAPSEWRFSAQPKEALSGGDTACPCREQGLHQPQKEFAAGTPLPDRFRGRDGRSHRLWGNLREAFFFGKLPP